MRNISEKDFLNRMLQEYKEQWNSHYAQVPMTCYLGKKDEQTVMYQSIRSEAKEPLGINAVVSAVATFKQRGRPIDKHNIMRG